MMTYIRKKKIKGYTYYYIVEGVYDDKGKVNQKVIKYLGTIENILQKYKFREEQKLR